MFEHINIENGTVRKHRGNCQTFVFSVARVLMRGDFQKSFRAQHPRFAKIERFRRLAYTLPGHEVIISYRANVSSTRNNNNNEYNRIYTYNNTNDPRDKYTFILHGNTLSAYTVTKSQCSSPS